MISQHQSQHQQLKILPQQIQLLNLYFLNSLELQQRIKQELEENPFLEAAEQKSEEEEEETKQPADIAIDDFKEWEEINYEDKTDFRQEYSNYFDGENAPAIPIISIATFKEEAKQQLHLLDISEQDMVAAEYIIDILNPHGLMDLPVDEVADDMSFHFRNIIEPDIRKMTINKKHFDLEPKLYTE